MESEQKKGWLVPVIIGGGVGGVGIIILIITLVFHNGGGEANVLNNGNDEDAKMMEEKCEVMMAKFKAALTAGTEDTELERMYAEGSRECPNHFLPLENEANGDNTGEIATIPSGKDGTDQGVKPETVAPIVGRIENDAERPTTEKTPIKTGNKISFRSRVAKKLNFSENSLAPKSPNTTESVIDPNSTDPKTPKTSDVHSTQKTELSNFEEPAKSSEPLKPKEASKSSEPLKPKEASKSNEPAKSIDPAKGDDKAKSENGVTGSNDKRENGNKVNNSELEDVINKNKKSKKLNLPPQEMKALRLKAAKDIDAKIKAFLAKGTYTLSEIVRVTKWAEEIRHEIIELIQKDIFPERYYFDYYLADFFKQQMVKAFRSDNVTEAQKWYDLYLGAYGSDFWEFLNDPKKCPKPAKTPKVTDLHDYKLWSAIEKGDFEAARNIIASQDVMLPKFMHKELCKPENQYKLKILKELNEDQFNAFWDYWRLNNTRINALEDYYNFNGNESYMQENAVLFKKTAEMMKLLHPDIHPNFNFETPELPEVKTIMQEVAEYLKDKPKLPGFENAWKALESDPKRGVKTIMEVILKVPNSSNDREKILIDFKRMKSHLERDDDENLQKFENSLLDIVKSFLEKNLDKVNRKSKCALEKASSDKNNFELVLKFFDVLIAHGGSDIFVAALKFWKAVVPFILERKGGSFISVYGEIDRLDPCDIDKAADKNSVAMVQCSAECIQAIAASPTATEVDKAHAEYAKAFAQLTSKVDAKKISLLWKQFEYSKRDKFILTIPLDLLIPVVRSKEKLLALKSYLYDRFDSKHIIELCNKKVVEILKEREKKFGSSYSYWPNIESSIDRYTKDDKVEPNLNGFSIKLLLKFLEDHFYSEWTPLTPPTNPLMPEIMTLFATWKKDDTKEAQKKFFAAAQSYVMKLQNENFDSLSKG